MSSRRGIYCLIILAVATAVVTTGCRVVRTVDAVWPTADSERSVPKPSGPPRWPLTGIDAPSEEAIGVRPVSVKIENSAASRPQTGLDMADLVYETVTEGGITRFNVIFQSQEPPAVGPVRSARASDLYIVPQYDALFAHCGGPPALMKEIKSQIPGDMDQFFNPGPYYRSTEKPAPHNLFLDIAKLRLSAKEKRGLSITGAVRPLVFERTSRPSTPTITAITVPFAPDNKAEWVFDPVSRSYARSVNGKAHLDSRSKKQYTARNVVVMWARTKTFNNGGVGKDTLEIVLTGTGRVSVFREGQRYDGSWTADVGAPPLFKAQDGTAIKLSTGNTWFQVIANDQNIVMK
jgi:hypothetical protein